MVDLSKIISSAKSKASSRVAKAINPSLSGIKQYTLADIINIVNLYPPARSDLFRVVMPDIQGLNLGNNDPLVESITIPQYQFTTDSILEGGLPTYFPSEVALSGQVSLTLYTDQNYSARQYINSWTNLMYNTATRTYNYEIEYKKNILVTLFEGAGNPTTTLHLINCFPISISDIDLNSSSDERSTVQVTFSVAAIKVSTKLADIGDTISEIYKGVTGLTSNEKKAPIGGALIKK